TVAVARCLDVHTSMRFLPFILYRIHTEAAAAHRFFSAFTPCSCLFWHLQRWREFLPRSFVCQGGLQFPPSHSLSPPLFPASLPSSSPAGVPNLLPLRRR